MSNKPERVNLSWTPIGNVFISSTDLSTAYVRADVVEKMLKERQQMCANAIDNIMADMPINDWDVEAIIDACLSATGEANDEKG